MKNFKPKVVVYGAGEYYSKIRKGIQTEFQITKLVNSKIVPTRSQLSQADCFIIISPPQTHLEIIRTLVGYGKPIFVDKPLVGTSQELSQLIHISQGGKNIYCSDFYADCRAGKLFTILHHKDIRRLGKILHIQGTLYEGGRNGSFEHRPWLWDPVYGGVVLDLLYHFLFIVICAFPTRNFKILNKKLIKRNSTSSETEVEILAALDDVAVHLKAAKYKKRNFRYLRFDFSRGQLIIYFNKQNPVYRIFQGNKVEVATSSNYYFNVPRLFKEFVVANDESYHFEESCLTLQLIEGIKK